jgi:uncharacterized surface protein with fasciclin (FAS1) repeats
MKNLFSIILFAFALTFFFSSCDKKDNEVETNAQPFTDFLKSKPELSLYAAALEKAGLQSYINGPGPFTFFAPTNDAFTAAKITQDSLNKMTPGAINYLLMYHTINALVTTTDLFGAQFSFSRGTQIGNTASTQMFLGTRGDSSYINGTNIISPDNMVSNGVIHIINQVQVPPVFRGNMQAVLTNTGQHSLFIAALTRGGRWAGLTGTGPFTIMAPTDAAMSAAGFTLSNINAAPVSRMDSLVRYHYFTGTRLFTNDLGNRVSPQTALGVNRTLLASGNGKQIKGNSNATPVNIIQANLLGTNGVVHVIDGVLRY